MKTRRLCFCFLRGKTSDHKLRLFACACRRLVDIFGNPFRQVAVNAALRTAAVVKVAHGIYDERSFDRPPILVDALEDAGCSDADLLGHQRDPGQHVRGCWPLDLVLWRE